MSFAYMPLFTGDYRRDTQHLTPLKHGIYLLLLMHCWDTRNPAPLDEQECAGIANCRSADEIEALRYVLSRFFTRMEDGFYNKRLQIEIEKSEAVSRARSVAGKRGYQALAKHLRGKSQAIAGQVPLTPIPIPNTIPIPKENPLVGLAPDVASRSAKKGEERAIARRVLDVLNRNAGRRYGDQDANLNLILARLREGYTERELCAIAAVKASQWKVDERMSLYLRPKTLFNATNAAQYRAELPANQIEDEDA